MLHSSCRVVLLVRSCRAAIMGASTMFRIETASTTRYISSIYTHASNNTSASASRISLSSISCCCVLSSTSNPQLLEMNASYLVQQQVRRMVTVTTTKATTTTAPTNVAQNNNNNKEETSNVRIDDVAMANEEDGVIHVTQSCINRIKKLASKRPDPEKIYLRVFVDAGGCSGFQYKFELEDDSLLELENDIIIKYDDDVRVVVDQESMKLIQGSTIDFSESMIKSSFEVTNNPLSEKACGCGSSFAVKKFQLNPVTH